MQGRIIKGIAGFYYVYTAESGVYECKARGIFRKQNRKPLVGDLVQLDVIDEEERTGNITCILPRKNALIRPAVANIDQALIIFALASPEPNLNLLDRFLVMMEQQQVPTVICMNKLDLAAKKDVVRVREAYETAGYPVFFFSAVTGEGVSPIREQLRGKTSTVAGPSGVGKSTLINLLTPHAQMETGEVSEKIQRGRHTTRHAELIAAECDTFICDTPGFSSLSVDYERSDAQKTKSEDGCLPMKADTLEFFFPEFELYRDRCRFRGCSHLSEPGCAVKAAVEDGKISRSRYGNYEQIYKELKDKKRY
ncbi:MAG: ribosome small subunit-dependent GTPase A [Clostridiales bacterium]|nr:ribosome small subunit-dependent GTPase A [Clostridiales bacterium]